MNNKKAAAIFTDREMETLIQRIVAGHADGITEGDIIRIVRWAEQARMDGAMVNLLMDGKLYVGVDSDGGMQFWENTARVDAAEEV